LRGTDEKAMFNALLKILEDFATENNIDIIASSQNKTIRTNRTGGLFETAMNERIQAVGQEFTFETPQQFSFSPDYKLDAMDILWTKPS
ncbi:MAG TPA: hypothetical protein VFQ63_00775, partial [Patescibacteria group bacterium]|nr:hypothetical protein [Patescibacteria group bacterium]